jgi:hypothetical protein
MKKRYCIAAASTTALVVGFLLVHGARKSTAGSHRELEAIPPAGKSEARVVPVELATSAPDSSEPRRLALRRTVVHRASDFSGRRFGDAVVTDALRLNDAPARNDSAGAVMGSYFSPMDEQPMSPEAQMNATFDKIALWCDADAPPGAAVKLEFRVIAYDEDGEGWSDWREMRTDNSGAAVSLGYLAQKWQYRITLANRDATAGPVVRSVTVMTERDPELAAKTFAFAERLP